MSLYSIYHGVENWTTVETLENIYQFFSCSYPGSHLFFRNCVLIRYEHLSLPVLDSFFKKCTVDAVQLQVSVRTTKDRQKMRQTGHRIRLERG